MLGNSLIAASSEDNFSLKKSLKQVSNFSFSSVVLERVKERVFFNNSLFLKPTFSKTSVASKVSAGETLIFTFLRALTKSVKTRSISP